MKNEVKPLSEQRAKSRVLVHSFTGGKAVRNRLLVLGFTIGAEVTVLQNFGTGPIILSVKDSRVALGRGEAKKVMVKVID